MIYNLIKDRQKFILFPDHPKDANHWKFFNFKKTGSKFWVKDKSENAIQALLKVKREIRLPEIPIYKLEALERLYGVSEAMYKSQYRRKPGLLIELEIVDKFEHKTIFETAN